MCGRYAIQMQLTEVKDRLGIPRHGRQEATSKEYVNFPPGLFTGIGMQSVEERGSIEEATAFWGFIPSWAKSASRSQHNARLETAATALYWRKAFHRRRCALPANWWYEWQRAKSGKQAYAIRPRRATDGFFFAGVWSLAKSLNAAHAAAGYRTYAVITTEADDELAFIHHRMPVALTDEGARAWLAEGDDTDDLYERLRVGMHSDYIAAPMSNAIGNVKNDDPNLVPESIKGYPSRYWDPHAELKPSV